MGAHQALLESAIRAVDEKELTEFTREIARIPSVHGDEKAIAHAFANRMGELGLETQLLEVETDRPNVVGWLRGEGGGRSLTLNGHMDTVHHCLGWTKNPYGGELENGKIYGHGVSNMKASDTAIVYAASALKRAGIRLKGDVVIALVVGECRGGVGTRDLMRREIKTDAFVCAEPTYLNVLTVHAYSQYFRVNITGRTGHFGTHDHGLNAIVKMYELIDRLGPVQAEIKPGGWIRFQAKALHRGLPRYHVGAIRGGLTTECLEGPSNTPDYCTAAINVRTAPDKKIEDTREDIEAVLADMQRAERGFTYEVSIIRDMPGFEAPADGLAVNAISEAYRTVTGTKPTVGPIQPYMFMGSDSGHMQVAGMRDGVLMGPGNFTSSVADEHVEVDKLIAAARIYATTAINLCGAT